MHKYLFVGDVHAVASELADCQALMDYAYGLAKEYKATLLLSGDIYHTHGIIDAEVQRFWIDFFDRSWSHAPCMVLEGNHDAPGTDGSKASALLAHKKAITVVSKIPKCQHGILFCPYATNEKVIAWAKADPTNTLICHATFDGAMYENGFMAPDGIDQEEVPQKLVIGGHIHTPHTIGKVWYPGAPRWRSKADANTDRAIWLLEFDDEGTLLKKTSYDTAKVCRKLVHLIDSEDSPVTGFTPEPNTEYRIDVTGSAEWIEERVPLYRGLAKVRTVKTDVKAKISVKESEGMAVAFQKWLENFKPKFGTPATDLLNLSRDRLHGVVI